MYNIETIRWPAAESCHHHVLTSNDTTSIFMQDFANDARIVLVVAPTRDVGSHRGVSIVRGKKIPSTTTPPPLW